MDLEIHGQILCSRLWYIWDRGYFDEKLKEVTDFAGRETGLNHMVALLILYEILDIWYDFRPVWARDMYAAANWALMEFFICPY